LTLVFVDLGDDVAGEILLVPTAMSGLQILPLEKVGAAGAPSHKERLAAKLGVYCE